MERTSTLLSSIQYQLNPRYYVRRYGVRKEIIMKIIILPIAFQKCITPGDA